MTRHTGNHLELDVKETKRLGRCIGVPLHVFEMSPQRLNMSLPMINLGRISLLSSLAESEGQQFCPLMYVIRLNGKSNHRFSMCCFL